MTKRLFFLFILFCADFVTALPEAWINEIHYDNSGADQNEFVEVVVKDPENYYLGDLALYMYNGYDGVQYCLDTVDEFDLGDREGHYQIYTWYQRGIQNDTEGMILVFRDTLVDILAYEGSFVGNNVPALGLTFPDIGVKETGYGPDTCAIYLCAMPGSDWAYGTATPGELNPGQSVPDNPLPVKAGEFNAIYLNDAIHLHWRTASESGTSVFQIVRNGHMLTSMQGCGHSSACTDYSYIDKNVSKNEQYEYEIKEIHFSGKLISHQTLNIHTYCPKDFGLGLPFPNPANPESKINIEVFRPCNLKMRIYDLSGHMIREVMNKRMTIGNHHIRLDLHDLPSGKYIVKCEANDRVESFNITLLK